MVSNAVFTQSHVDIPCKVYVRFLDIILQEVIPVLVILSRYLVSQKKNKRVHDVTEVSCKKLFTKN